MSNLLLPNASNLVPGQNLPEFETQENELGWGRWDQQVQSGAFLSSTATDAGNTSATNIIRCGLALGMIAASSKVKQWDPYATDGSHRLMGFYKGPGQMMDLVSGTPKDRMIGDILVGGNVYADRVIIPGETNKGISGKSYEFLLREACVGRFRFSDEWEGGYSNWKYRELTADATATIKDHRTHFTNVGAAGAVTLTLPAPLPGLEFIVSVIANQNIVLEAPATGEYFKTAVGANQNSATLAAANKETIRVYGIRTAATPTYQYKLAPINA